MSMFSFPHSLPFSGCSVFCLEGKGCTTEEHVMQLSLNSHSRAESVCPPHDLFLSSHRLTLPRSPSPQQAISSHGSHDSRHQRERDDDDPRVLSRCTSPSPPLLAFNRIHMQSKRRNHFLRNLLAGLINHWRESYPCSSFPAFRPLLRIQSESGCS